jgi:prephenate dehydrogenase
VPAHPIAGKERTGVESADVNLYAGRKVILTPVARTLTNQLSRAQSIWTSLGCSVESMSPDAHDAAFAAVSHLPHLLAFALMNSITTQKNGDDYLSLAGTGFRDFTRIAASDPEMWHDIFMANKVQMTLQIEQFQQALDLMASMISNSDSKSLQTSIAHASVARKNWHLSNELPTK